MKILLREVVGDNRVEAGQEFAVIAEDSFSGAAVCGLFFEFLNSIFFILFVLLFFLRWYWAIGWLV